MRACLAAVRAARVCWLQLTDHKRDFDAIERAGKAARDAVLVGQESLQGLADAVNASYAVQLGEGQPPLPDHGQMARKYCGGGFGGYALYLFGSREARDAFVGQHGGKGKDGATAIEPYERWSA